MNLVRHLLDVKAPRQTVFTSITTAAGLSSWWTAEVQGDDTGVGSLFRFTFRGPFNPRLRITELDSPSLVTWKGVGGHDPWGPTTIRFRLDPADGGTMVHFSHEMGPDVTEDAVASANFNWGYYLGSLRLLCETGRGTPYQPGSPGARVGASTS